MNDGRLHNRVCWYNPKKEELKGGNLPRKRVLVYVTSHDYRNGGRVSNFVSFSPVEQNGTVDYKTDWGTYDWGQFTIAEDRFVAIRICKI